MISSRTCIQTILYRIVLITLPFTTTYSITVNETITDSLPVEQLDSAQESELQQEEPSVSFFGQQQQPTTTLSDSSEYDDDQEDDKPETEQRVITAIIIEGNHHIPTDTILNRVAFVIGEPLYPHKVRATIKNLFYELKRFRSINVFKENNGANGLTVYVVVEEKKLLDSVNFKGNKSLSESEIRKKIDFNAIPTIDEKEAEKIATAIKKLYIEKNYHLAAIEPIIEEKENDHVDLTFLIHEGKRSLVKRLFFSGNHHISAKQLRTNIFTKEDWILGFLDRAGNYQPDKIEADKHIIEQTYQNKGFLTAKVLDVDIDRDTATNHVNITYHIQEGERYTIGIVKAPGNDILNEENVLASLPLQPGALYSREAVGDSIKFLEKIWGNLGYVYAHVEPSIQPDEATKTVNISFYSEPGNKIYLHKLNVKGNRKTKDKIIRRKIALEEGGLITTQLMDYSKNNIEALGYFEPRDGANWKMTRIDEELADLDIIVNEIKTGRAHIKFGFGGVGIDAHSPGGSFSTTAEIADTNLFGSGIHLNLNATVSKEEQNVIFNIAQPWLFDKPISGSLDFHHRRISYDEFKLIRPVNEKLTGGAFTLGFLTGITNDFLRDTFVRFSLGIDSIHYERDPQVIIPGNFDIQERSCIQQQFNTILAKLFEEGTYVWLGSTAGQDHKNHPLHASRGHKWLISQRVGIPTFGDNIGFYKADFDAHWYNPIIGEYDLVLHLHGYLGLIHTFNTRVIPYRELFHIGGPSSVRGFLFGEIGPRFVPGDRGDSIGGSRAAFVNVELIFPIKPDMTMKGLFFYDGGSGWNNPYAKSCNDFVKNEHFSYRHAVGFGLRMLEPMPVRIDWGFKLDPKKNEVASEVHFGMTYDW